MPAAAQSAGAGPRLRRLTSKAGGGSPQRFSSDLRCSSAILAALLLVLSAPAIFAQQPAPFPATATPYASTPVLPPRLHREQAHRPSFSWPSSRARPIRRSSIGCSPTPARSWETPVPETSALASPLLLPKAGGTKLLAARSPGMRLPTITSTYASSSSTSPTEGWCLVSSSRHFTDANGNEQSVPVDFGWYPLINAYGGNFPLDADSVYALRVTIDRTNSEHPTIAEFPPVPIVQDAMRSFLWRRPLPLPMNLNCSNPRMPHSAPLSQRFGNNPSPALRNRRAITSSLTLSTTPASPCLWQAPNSIPRICSS